ncbi:MAG TPA: hypothetical protein VGF28_24485 [Thermoanaerobaculia bacterium]|jgi:hypothetical protein
MTTRAHSGGPAASDVTQDRFVPAATAGAVLFAILLIFFGRW